MEQAKKEFLKRLAIRWLIYEVIISLIILMGVRE